MEQWVKQMMCEKVEDDLVQLFERKKPATTATQRRINRTYEQLLTTYDDMTRTLQEQEDNNA